MKNKEMVWTDEKCKELDGSWGFLGYNTDFIFWKDHTAEERIERVCRHCGKLAEICTCKK